MNYRLLFLAAINPRTAGVWATFARPGGGRMTTPPDNSKTKKDSDKQ